MENRPLYSAEITEIIGTPPRWILRAGGGLLLLALVVLVGLAATIRLPEPNRSALRISSSVPPYYLRQGAQTPVAAAGQLIRRGQPLAISTPDSAPVAAPFTGRLLLLPAAEAATQTGDTLGVLLPANNAYQFSGRIDLGHLRELQRLGSLPIEVPLDDQADNSLRLRGHLRYLSPEVRGGTVAYVGQLDSASSTTLARHFTGLTNLEGCLLLRSHSAPILQRLLQ